MNWLDELKEQYKGDRFFTEVFDDKIYEIVKSREKPNVVLDIGANAGEFSFWMYDTANIIYAFEPHPEIFKELKQNIDKYNLSKIKPFKLGLYDYNGKAHLWSRERGGHSISIENDAEHQGHEVEVKTLATFMKEQNIDHVDILKIDIEGGEQQVFSSPDFKEIANKIDFIIGEHAHGNDALIAAGFIIEKYKHNEFIAFRKNE